MLCTKSIIKELSILFTGMYLPNLPISIEVLPGFWGTGEKGNNFRENGETNVKLREQRNKDNVGEQVKEQNFQFSGTGEQAYLFQGNKVTGTNATPGKASVFHANNFVFLLKSILLNMF